MRVQDKVAIVTGGGSGIGRSICLRLAEEGASVAVFDIDREAAQRTAGEILAMERQASAFEVDVSKAKQVEAGVGEALTAFKGIDILVNDAGVSSTKSVAKMTEDEWDSTLDVNLKGSFICCRAVIPSMKERRYGKIVNISSVLGFGGSPGRAHYGAAKTGVIGFTRSLAVEVGLHNINVNAVGPGIIETPMLDRDIGSELRGQLQGRIPLRRLGAPTDIANAVLFLVSDEASYITGQCLFVCGGWTASLGLA
jgi:3-oxoacyl-[acyl-carrier protein] reductase